MGALKDDNNWPLVCGSEGMEIILVGYIGTTIRIRSFIPNSS